jgi:hypothetical protein
MFIGCITLTKAQAQQNVLHFQVRKRWQAEKASEAFVVIASRAGGEYDTDIRTAFSLRKATTLQDLEHLLTTPAREMFIFLDFTRVALELYNPLRSFLKAHDVDQDPPRYLCEQINRFVNERWGMPSPEERERRLVLSRAMHRGRNDGDGKFTYFRNVFKK